MSRPKLTWVHASIIGVVVAMIVGGGLFFGFIKPANSEVEDLKTELSNVEGQVAQVANAEADRDAAIVENEQGRAELSRALRTKSPSASVNVNLGDLSTDARRRALKNFWRLPGYVAPTMEKFARDSGRRLKVEVSTSFSIAAPSTDPAAIPGLIIAWNLGTMEVTGKFLDVVRWVEGFNRAPLLSTVENLQLELADGEGRVNATCSLSTFVFPRLDPGVEITVSSGGGGGGGMAGSAPSGMMGDAAGGGAGPY